MKKYSAIKPNGATIKYPYIGLNHTSLGITIDDNASSYNKEFTNKDCVSLGTNAFGNLIHCKIGDIKEAYLILREEMKICEQKGIHEYALCVQNTVMHYFGNIGNDEEHMSYFPSDDEIKNDGKKMGLISSLAHKNIAMSIARAMLAQNLLIDIGIKSNFKVSGVIVNGKDDIHAYNVISFNKKYYIFDTTIPTIVNYNISPLICEISKEVYDKLISGHPDIGYSVEVSHFNPLQNLDCNIIYDAGREDVYKTNESLKRMVKK